MHTIAELADIDAVLGVHSLLLDLHNHHIAVGRGVHNFAFAVHSLPLAVHNLQPAFYNGVLGDHNFLLARRLLDDIF